MNSIMNKAVQYITNQFFLNLEKVQNIFLIQISLKVHLSFSFIF